MGVGKRTYICYSMILNGRYEKCLMTPTLPPVIRRVLHLTIPLAILLWFVDKHNTSPTITRPTHCIHHSEYIKSKRPANVLTWNYEILVAQALIKKSSAADFVYMAQVTLPMFYSAGTIRRELPQTRLEVFLLKCVIAVLQSSIHDILTLLYWKNMRWVCFIFIRKLQILFYS